MPEEEEVEDNNDTAYLYRIPLEVNGSTREAAYDVTEDGTNYLSYYSANEHVVITDTATGYLHRDDVNVYVEELDLSEVESSDSLSEDFV